MAQDPALSSSIPSRQVLEEVAPRALKFLGAVGRFFAIRAKLAARGYDDAEHRRAWDLLHRVSHYKPEATASLSHDQVVRTAVVTLDQWDERGFQIAGATLKHRHRPQHDFVFDGLTAAQGEAAVLSVKTFLDRLDALESSPDRAATRDADLAALVMLAKRGIDGAERARLRGLVDTAQSAMPVPEDSQERQQDLVALYAWLDEWSTVAKAEISRRDHLIALGLLKRRKKKADKAEAPAEGQAAASGASTAGESGSAEKPAAG